MGYVFYALETTGPNPLTDRISRVRAEHVNYEYKILDTVDIDIGPTGGTTDTYRMMLTVANAFRDWSPAIFIGYNSLRAYEPFLRRAFWEALVDPFLLRTERSGSSDVLRYLEAAAIWYPTALKTARKSDRTADMSIAAISQANSIPTPATVRASDEIDFGKAVCRLIEENAPEVASSCAQFSLKASVTHFLQEQEVIVWSDFFAGKPYTRKVTSIEVTESPSRWSVYDLAVDPATLLRMTDDQLLARLAQSPRPVWDIPTRGCPTLTVFDPTALSMGLSAGDLLNRARAIRDDEHLRQRIWTLRAPRQDAAFPIRYPSLSAKDLTLRDSFHHVPWRERAKIAAEMGDEALKSVASALIAAHQDG